MPGLLVCLVLFVFGAVLQFDFVRWDDPLNVTHNPLITEPWSWNLLGRLCLGETALRFKPLHWLLDRAIYSLFGFQPAAWHSLNLGLHLLVTLLFYRTLQRLFTRVFPVAVTAPVNQAAFFGAALWAVHPLRAEPVAWVTGSTYPLATLCLLGAFHLHLAALGATDSSDRRRAFGGSWTLAVLSYGCYPIGTTYALGLAGLDRWLQTQAALPAEPPPVPWRRWGYYGLLLVPALLALGVTYWSASTRESVFLVPPTLESVGLLTRLKMALATLGALLGKFFWPGALTPNIPPLPPGAEHRPDIFLSAAATASALTLLWLFRRRWRQAALLAGGFCLLSLPVLGLTQYPTWPMVDRYSYLPHLVLAGVLAGAGLKLVLHRGWNGPMRMTALVAVIGLTALTRQQVATWRDSNTLFRHITQHPGFGENLRQQAYVYALWGAQAAETAQAAQAAELYRHSRQTYLAAMQEAVTHRDYNEALGLAAIYENIFGLPPVLRCERGSWLIELGRPAEAQAELERADRENPGDLRTQELLARLQAKKSK